MNYIPMLWHLLTTSICCTSYRTVLIKGQPFYSAYVAHNHSQVQPLADSASTCADPTSNRADLTSDRAVSTRFAVSLPCCPLRCFILVCVWAVTFRVWCGTVELKRELIYVYEVVWMQTLRGNHLPDDISFHWAHCWFKEMTFLVR